MKKLLLAFLLFVFSINVAFALPTGGVITNYTDGGTLYYVHTFTSSGVFNNTETLTNVSYLIVGGGGFGGFGYGGGAGAGQLILTNGANFSINSYNITVGNGSSSAAFSNACNNNNAGVGCFSSFNSIVALGGGTAKRNACGNQSLYGSGGGGAGNSAYFAPCPSTYGNAGGTALTNLGAGGGGAGGVGGNSVGTTPGAGGPGVNVSINGSIVCYAGGGAGVKSGVAGTATCGGGSFAAGSPNTGGGGSGIYAAGGYAGGSGIVIVRYTLPSAPTNTCTYSGTGTWNINISDNCTLQSQTINSPILVTGNNGILYINGTVLANKSISFVPTGAFTGKFIVAILKGNRLGVFK